METRSGLFWLFILFTGILSCPRALADEGDAPDDSSGSYKFMVAKQFEKSVQNVAAGEPTPLWPPTPRRKKPLPTNKYWQNFVLNHGSAPEYIHPYTIQSANSSISVGYPKRQVSQSSISQLHASDILVSARSSNLRHFVSRYDDLTVTLQLGDAFRVPLVRGSPYVTFLFSNSVPVFSSPHSITNVSVSSDSMKYSVLLSNGQKWIIYTSAPLQLDGALETQQAFTGTIRLALVPNSSPEEESLLDAYSRCYVTSARVTYDTPDASSPVTLSYIFRTEGGSSDLLLLALPLHRALLEYSTLRLSPQFRYQSIDGELQGVIGSVWKLHSRSPTGSISWHSVAGIRNPAALAKLGSALAKDVSNLRPINITSTYFFGKSIARAARLALIADEIGVSDLRSALATYLDDNLSPWLDATVSANAIVYDSKWGGLISQQGAFDPGADFGLGLYNDHHYHWGYFVYAGAVLSKLDPEWGSRYRTNLYSLVGDYMSPGRMPRSGTGWAHFPRTRHFDPWVMHSWAGGLTEFADGRNQESTSEAVNAYYSAALLGRAFGDEELVRMGSALAGLEIWGARSLWHIRRDSDLYEEEFVSRNRVSGVVWANKRDSNLWFSCGRIEQCRVGIQVIPVTPVTEALFEDVDYNRQLFEWVAGALESDPWKGFAFAVQATYDPMRAKGNVELLERFDDGNSLTNMLWWIYSRPAAASLNG